jgi:2-aminoadipate transaminase
VSAGSTDVISFARGIPSPDLIDLEALARATERALRIDGAGASTYGHAAGYLPLRRWIAERHGVELERVMVTNGSMQACGLVLEELCGRGDLVAVERPSYDRALLALRGIGARLRGVAMEPDGLALDELEEDLVAGFVPSLLYTIPNFQNPTGRTLSSTKRRRLLELAADHGFPILEDDPYGELHFDGRRAPTMLSLQRGQSTVIHVSSFSKTVCPGLRVGYVIAAPELIGRLTERAANTYIAPGTFAQAVVHQFCLGGGLESSTARIRGALEIRAEVLARRLALEVPEGRFVVPRGGYFLWLELPQEIEVERLAVAAAERRLAVLCGADFMVDGLSNGLRLSYAGTPPERIAEGVRRLAHALSISRDGVVA